MCYKNFKIGRVIYYNNIDNNIDGVFNVIDTLFTVEDDKKNYIYEGMRSAPFVRDIDNDGYPELILGNFAGGLTLFNGIVAPADTLFISETKPTENILKVYPNPFHEYITISSEKAIEKLQLKIFSVDGRLIFEENLSSLSNVNISTEDISIGVYIMQITFLLNKKENIEHYKMIKTF